MRGPEGPPSSSFRWKSPNEVRGLGTYREATRERGGVWVEPDSVTREAPETFQLGIRDFAVVWKAVDTFSEFQGVAFLTLDASSGVLVE